MIDQAGAFHGADVLDGIAVDAPFSHGISQAITGGVDQLAKLGGRQPLAFLLLSDELLQGVFQAGEAVGDIDQKVGFHVLAGANQIVMV